MYALIILQADSIPVVLGPVGSIVSFILILVSGLLNAYQFRRSTTSEEWRGAALARKEELDAVRERADRLEGENKTMVAALAELKAKTDLTMLQQQGMEFERKNQEVHEKIVLSLNTLLDNNTTRYAQITATMLENTNAMQLMREAMEQLGDRMTREFELHRTAFANMTLALQGKME